MITQTQCRELETIRKYVALGMDDTAARALSALVRCARTNGQRDALMVYAGPQVWGFLNHPEFIV